MSRVFVSCSYRDRALGRRVVDLLRGMGHEVKHDRGDAGASNWWDDVVSGIETSDVFVAVGSPSYASAHACRLAAKHAAELNTRVLRLDIAEAPLERCHPVVAEAAWLPFDPDDEVAVHRLAETLDDTDDPDDPDDPDGPEPEVDHGMPPAVPLVVQGSRATRLEAVVAVVLVVAAGALVVQALRSLGTAADDLPVDRPTAAGSGPTESAAPTDGAGRVAALLATVAATGERYPAFALPGSTCRVGDAALTCRNPAPNIQTVVLESFLDRQALYAGYAATLAELAGGPVTENSGNCSFDGSEGELGWNLDERHTREHSMAGHVAGDLDPRTEAAGRVYCTASGEVMRLVWTQDPGLLVTVTGQPSDRVIDWWRDVHLQLACVGGATGSGCEDQEASS